MIKITRKKGLILGVYAAAFGLGCGQDGQGATAPGPQLNEVFTGSCTYINRFSSGMECKTYTGSGWDLTSASEDCGREQSSSYSESTCATASALGFCDLETSTPLAVQIVFPGENEDACAITKQGCEIFASGTFTAAPLCEGVDLPDTPPQQPVIGGTVFTPPELVCQTSIDDRSGQSENQEVCTWQSIGGCTEPGRKFADYASCEPVLTQRPYFAVPPANFKTPEGDPLYEDPAFQAELAWVKSEAESCGCVCCHTTGLSPLGAAAFDTAAEGIWTDSFTERGLAIAAGWIDSAPLGAHPSDENNGFDRMTTGLPTTDVERMVRFFEGELARRGVERSQFENATPIGGPLYTQSLFEPEPCEDGEGVSQSGLVQWSGGNARYIYLLASGSDNPGVPPNRDQPEGTLWKLDVDSKSDALPSGVMFGSTPEGTYQRVPENGMPVQLNEGQEYYLYVLADIGAPITRCLFVYQGSEDTPSTSPSNETPETPTVSQDWNKVCMEDGDCGAGTNYCVKMPGASEGYCSIHCDSQAACASAGAPSDWTCNAVSCSIPDYTWCGPTSEIASSGGFLSVCE